MSTHIPNAPYVAIHSVCVAADYRRKGVAVALLKEYLARVRAQGRKGARLITHEELVPLYTKAGFELVGESSVVHGERKWWEMKVDFPEPPAKEVVESEKAVAAAVEPEVRSPGLVWESFGGMDVLLDVESRNAGDLFCPRGECRCLLLKAGVAKWVRGHDSDFVVRPSPLPLFSFLHQLTPKSFQLPELPRPITSPAPSVPSSGYWSISSPLAFENIGFSRNASLPSSSAATIKYLICADCDHGPLGWHDTEGRDLGLEVEVENEGKGGELRKGREFLLDVGRVRYRVR